jgi:phosphinothricin acetyltransferase
MGMTGIREAREADLAAITEIYAQSVLGGTASFETEPPDQEEMGRRMAAIVERGYPYLVAAEGNTIFGFAYAAAYRTRLAYRYTVEDSIYLTGAARGRGIGGALLRRLIEESEGRGYRQMIAVIGDSANHASIRLHKAAGFAMVGTLSNVGFKHGRWVDSVIMQRSLGPGAEVVPDR